MELAGMANVKHKIITMPRLQSSLDDVMDELDEPGLWNERLAKVDVYLTWVIPGVFNFVSSDGTQAFD